ncbi:MAG: mannitol dehydrogenase family protein [Pseudotabrizicola sp.]|nr:mannitol dehydrogenase family protein [Pseudotabrizicola sp.]MDO8881402.1 mannitol dehydrogenase family protein [Pseudotabrizicola sp.]MDP2081557.1 mannitol dehydrogenase family protein [Pseudotabrizicola sp.]MDZ7575760.1 mannitol dehydrogenase family protein [Pseudotabrizicola sp.]
MPADRLTRSAPAVPVGIVHLGLGAFFRAHGAVYIEEAMSASGGDWGILGVSLQSTTMRDQLTPQGGTYTALELGPDGETLRHVQSVQGVLVAREDPGAVLEAMADPGVKIVSLTVTEKGYCHEPSTGRLNLRHPDILHDLATALPVSAPGFLVRALALRHARGLAAFTVLTCDNLPNNGQVVRGVVLDLARAIDPALADWIQAECRFPSTMVDRIVPATKPEDIARVAALIGAQDAAPVLHEPFRQWVVEDDFIGGLRPDLGAVGVQMVADVTEYEHMKLRMLNGTHSSLAYLGYLSGHETIADCMADPVLDRFVQSLWSREIIPALTPPEGVSLADYAGALHARYANPSIRHRTWQIAMDGSQKLPQRILGTLETNLEAGRPCPGLMLAVAAWMIYVRGTDLTGAPIEVKDPLAPRLREAATSADPVGALLGLRAVFPEALANRLEQPLRNAYATLVNQGAKAAMETLA